MNEFSLASYIKNRFDGILAIGDVHADLASFERAASFARTGNYFLLSLGDIVDRGDNPYEVVESMAQIVRDGIGGFVIGNHDDKFGRFSRGNKVQFSVDGNRTLEQVGPSRLPKFLELYNSIMDDSMLSGIYHTFDDIILTHAASHPAMWGVGTFGKSARNRALVGETNGELHQDGYPVRLYNWIDEIPMGKTVIVGHDRMPIHDVLILEPLTVRNAQGGRAVFIDTGCGKSGFLSGALITHTKSRFVLDTFLEFK